MDAAVQEHARAPAIPMILAQPASLLSYNISLNLSSIFSMLPTSRFLTRIRRGMPWNGRDEVLYPSTTSSISEWSLETLAQVAQAEPTTANSTTTSLTIDPFPGPWAFFTSWYMLGLFLMAVLLHRIQNVIIPSRGPQNRRQRHAYRFAPSFAPRFQMLHRFYDLVLPLDFSRTTTRFILHLPSAYFLSRMLLVWFLLVLQTSELQVLSKWGALHWLNKLVEWNSAKDMNGICWATFCAVCAAFIVEGFVKALDGMVTGFPIGSVNPNTSPFNLVGYAFLLHVYSSPITHSFKPLDDTPSRPDKHVLITIAIPLLQLTIFHLLSISKRLSTHRLFPTALASMLSLLHFHGTLFSHYRRSQLAPAPTPTQRSSPHINYPLLNYIPNFFETLLICTILLTVFLNAFAQILVRGRVDRVLSGLGIGHGSTLHDDDGGSQGFWANMPLDEDFGVLLLRVGIASLEATGLRGWGNEVAPIALPGKAIKERKSRITAGPLPTYGSVRIGRMDVNEVGYGAYMPRPSASGSTSARPLQIVDQGTGLRRRKGSDMRPRKQVRHGFNNEVRNIDLGNAEVAAQDRPGYTPLWRWLKEFYAYLVALWSVLKGLVMFLLDRARGHMRISESMRKGTREPFLVREAGSERDDPQDVDAGVSREERRRRKDKALYQRFLRGEDISDDDDDHVEDTEGTSSEDDEIADSDDDQIDDDDERQAEAITLFADLLQNRSINGEDTGGGEMVLAHLAHGGGLSTGPLTRRGWNALFQPGGLVGRRRSENEASDSDDSGENQIRNSRMSIFDDEPGAEQRFENVCVICTNEKRDVICWPCRCLAMCDGCREALASKSAPAKHRCPCCRQSVDGYSKIYIP